MTWIEIFKCNFYGLRMDMSMAAYLSAIPFLLSVFWPLKYYKNLLFIPTLVFSIAAVIICSILIVADMELYKAWAFRIDNYVLDFLRSPKEAMAASSSSPIAMLVILLLIMVSLFCMVCYNLLRNTFKYKSNGGLIWPLIALFLTALLILPMRGGIGIAPLNQSAVFFSNNHFANNAAINAVWNFMSSIFHSRDNHNPFAFTSKESASQLIDSLYKKVVTQKVIQPDRPNILIIMWESGSQKVVDQSKNDVAITPGLNRLKEEAIYFENIYASGDRTEKGLCAVLSGFPSQPITSISKELRKSKSLPSLSETLKTYNYFNSFYYGGDSEFANMKAYLKASLFDEILDLNDFPASMHTSKWGVYDEHLFDKFLNQHQVQRSQPFFSILLTLSSHEPFITPTAPVIAGDDEESKFLNSLHYTDNELNKFIDKAKATSWWKNTVVIIVADHGHRLPDTGKKIDNFKIPLLFLGGAINEKHFSKKQIIGSQIDIAATLLTQMDIDASPFKWSKDLFINNNWAHFSFNNGLGFVTPDGYLIYENVGKRLIEGNVTDSLSLSRARALQQMIFEDYLKR